MYLTKKYMPQRNKGNLLVPNKKVSLEVDMQETEYISSEECKEVSFENPESSKPFMKIPPNHNGHLTQS
jgi:hypothetical protein